MSRRIVIGGSALMALGGCGSASSGDDGRASTPTPRTAVSTTTLVASSTVVSTSGSSGSSASSRSSRRASADLRVDGASISVEDDGAGALVVTTLQTEAGWTARVDDSDPAALVVELTAAGRRTVVDIRLTAGGITTSTDSTASSP